MAQRGEGECDRYHRRQEADYAVYQRNILRLVHGTPPRNEPKGIADQASTPAMLITRPSRWFGTIACRKLPVLILREMPKPDISAQRTRPIQ